jgi:hypothetical protein
VSEYKKVRIRMTVEYDVEYPVDFDADMIDFHRNDSSWCANNAIRELHQVADELKDVFDSPNSEECLCRAVEFEYLHDVGEPYSKA